MWLARSSVLLVLAGCRLGFDEVPVEWVELDASASGGGVSNVAEGVQTATGRVAVGPSGNPVVAWTDDTDGDFEVRVRAWDGSAWIELGGSASGGGVSNDTALSRAGGLAITSDDRPCISWRNDGSSLRLKCWNGTTWVGLAGSEKGIASGGNPWWPRLALDPDDQPILAWEDYGPEPSAIYLRRFDPSTGWVEAASSATATGLSGSAGPAIDAGLATFGNQTWVTWERTDVEDVFAAEWNGVSWSSRGNVTTTASLSERHTTRTGPAGTFVAWMEHVSGGTAIHLKMWDGRSWVELAGSATDGGVSAGRFPARYPALELDDDGNPIVAFVHDDDVYVMRWTGTRWRALGEQTADGGISNSGRADWPGLAVGPEGRAFVTWSHDENQLYLRALDVK